MSKVIAILITLGLLIAGLDVFYNRQTHKRLPRVNVNTQFGELTLELWPQFAPEHVDQFLKLVDAGIYNSSRINRIAKNFIVYFAGSFDRPMPLTAEQS